MYVTLFPHYAWVRHPVCSLFTVVFVYPSLPYTLRKFHMTMENGPVGNDVPYLLQDGAPRYKLVYKPDEL